MQAFKKHLIRTCGAWIIAWDTDNGSGAHVMPAQIPITGDSTTGKYNPRWRDASARAEFFHLLESAALLRSERQADGAYAYVVGAKSMLELARIDRQVHDICNVFLVSDAAELREMLKRMRAADDQA